MPKEDTYYEVLQVAPDAEVEVIKAAYRALAKKYHPDLNPNDFERARMTLINLAHEVLSDPEKRSAYDSALDRNRGSSADSQRAADSAYKARSPRGQAATGPSGATGGTYSDRPGSGQPGSSSSRSWSSGPGAGRRSSTGPGGAPSSGPAFSDARCIDCGKLDRSVRFSNFMEVNSFLVVSARRWKVGVFCSSCRRDRAFKHTLISALFGTFGVPFGPPFVVDAILTNITGGDQSASVNAQLLRNVAKYGMSQSDDLLTAQALAASLRFEYSQMAKDAIGELLARSPALSRVATGEQARLWAIPPLFVLIALIGAAFVVWQVVAATA